MNSLFKSCSILVIAVLMNLNYCQDTSNRVVNGDFSRAQGNDSSTTINNQEVKVFQNTSILGWDRTSSSFFIGRGEIFNPKLEEELALYLTEGNSVFQIFEDLIPYAYYNLTQIWAPKSPQNNQNLFFQTLWNDVVIFSTLGAAITEKPKINYLEVQADAGFGVIKFRVSGNNSAIRVNNESENRPAGGGIIGTSEQFEVIDEFENIPARRRGVAIDTVDLRLKKNNQPKIQNPIEQLKCNGFIVYCGSIEIKTIHYQLCDRINFLSLGTYCPIIKIEMF